MSTSSERFRAYFTYGSRPRPYRDWFMLLLLALAMFTLSFAWNAWLFLRVAAGESLGGTAAPVAPAWNAATLESVDAIFANRADEAARYDAQYPFVDPSK